MNSSRLIWRRYSAWIPLGRQVFPRKKMELKSTNILCNKSPSNFLYNAPLRTLMPKYISTIENNHFSKLAVDPAEVVPKLRQRMARKQELEKRDSQTVNVTGFATAEQYDLEQLYMALKEQKLYDPKKFFSSTYMATDRDVLYASAKYNVSNECREVFFFRQGSVVLWNFSDVEISNILSFLKQFEKGSYQTPFVKGEKEVVPTTYIPEDRVDIEGDVSCDGGLTRGYFQNGKFFLTNNEENFYLKYTLSDALSASIKLGIFEAMLERYINTIQFLTSDLSRGRRIRLSRSDMLKKTGELFALRHDITLSSHLLDVPDFYWDRDDLEALYLQIAGYYGISQRTKVMDIKINHCVELADLISSNLNDKHHIRLEWMIIILILVEVAFECLHFAERYYNMPLPNVTENAVT